MVRRAKWLAGQVVLGSAGLGLAGFGMGWRGGGLVDDCVSIVVFALVC